ncbi:hypothetical protein PR202_gb22559 [Eleusine coracana subsp. coracana]|uniref:Uncharacterized protein n=1 Tax=Eleusine coracana subsp. coracana TaxID=191504 RepID=A0AAV5FE34_ELECO|nr:hypothetical protein PR202_gb22559 [Eleusine coracana subsp. coracana]
MDEQAFPKGSPYVADLSRAILNLTESDELSLIERKWFGDAEGCAVQGSQFTSASLSFCSFWGLFLITGATSLLCAAVHLATFVVANRRPIRDASHGSWRGWFFRFLKLFDEKDLSSHTFKKKDAGGSVAGGRNSVDAGGASPAVTRVSDWSLQTASPAYGAGEIELAAAAGRQAEDEVTFAPNPPDAIIGGQNGTSHQQAQEEVAVARNPDGSSRDHQSHGRGHQQTNS